MPFHFSSLRSGIFLSGLSCSVKSACAADHEVAEVGFTGALHFWQVSARAADHEVAEVGFTGALHFWQVLWALEAVVFPNRVLQLRRDRARAWIADGRSGANRHRDLRRRLRSHGR
jgi:hypothetical protein